MKFHQLTVKASALAALSAALLLTAGPASAHCDGEDGPVIKAAQQALDTGNVNRVLIWVQASDQAQIKDAFSKTLDVRQLSPSPRSWLTTSSSRPWCECIEPEKGRLHRDSACGPRPWPGSGGRRQGA